MTVKRNKGFADNRTKEKEKEKEKVTGSFGVKTARYKHFWGMLY